MGRQAGMLHHIAERGLTPAAATTRGGEGADELVGLARMDFQALADRLDLFLQDGFVVGADLLELGDLFGEVLKVLVDGGHQLLEIGLRAFLVAFEMLIGLGEEAAAGLVEHALGHFSELLLVFLAARLGLGEIDAGLFGNNSLGLQLLAKILALGLERGERVFGVFELTLCLTGAGGEAVSLQDEENGEAKRCDQQDKVNEVEADRADGDEGFHGRLLIRFGA